MIIVLKRTYCTRKLSAIQLKFKNESTPRINKRVIMVINGLHIY